MRQIAKDVQADIDGFLFLPAAAGSPARQRDCAGLLEYVGYQVAAGKTGRGNQAVFVSDFLR